ncbi:MAG: DNA topoisomerase 4 subunit A, partial [Clostridiales bacterium]|nr:DNA topoisomerase 4 subunit A [Clostridiales bacterium]
IPEPKGNLFVTPLEEVLPSSMLPYAEFVILDRALPRVEDGLKPVQRRILYTMHEMGLLPDKPHKKSARIVGDCMGKYHPHGDSSVYDAMVRMAQDFNMGRTLVNGHGNFGSVDGDPAAAMRYTEARLEPLALELLRDLDKNTVPFSLNFDDSLKEPDMLPGRFPNLLVNGASGIAVGLATNIPPHNLGETIDGVVAYIDKPTIRLNEMLSYIKAPDFPTGGYIIANELNQAYKTGKGRITLRAKIRVEEGDTPNKKNIVITELPYQVNKSALLRRIAELREEKKDELAAITKVSDESDRVGMRAVVEVRSDADVAEILKYLYKYTDLETTFGMNMVAIAGGKPMLMGLMDIIRYYVNYQREVVLRRTRFDLNQAKERCHILEGLIVAVRNIDEVVAIIKKAESVADAREKLRNRFNLSDRQAQAILDLRLARLTRLEVYKLEEELKALKVLIEKLQAIVASNRLQLQVVKEELLEIKKKYKMARKSTLCFTEEEAAAERGDIREPGVQSRLFMTADHRLKCVNNKNFASANKHLTEKTKKQALPVWELPVVSDEPTLLFTNLGNCYKFYPQDAMRRFVDDGLKLTDLVEESVKGEYPVGVAKMSDERDLLFITKQGMIKKTAMSEYNVNKNAFPGIRLNDKDELLSVQPCEATEEEKDNVTLFFVTRGGMCLNARMDDIPLQGRVAGGVKGMNLKEKDEVIFAVQTFGEGEILVGVSGGRYKRIIVGTVDSLPRYRKGVMITSLKGDDKVIFADYVTIPYSLAVETETGEWVEINTEDIPIDITSTRGRPLKGVKWLPKAIYPMKHCMEEE